MSKINLVALVSLFLLVLVAGSDTPKKESYDVNNARPVFEDFKKKYNRTYKNAEDEELHLKAFVENLKKINESNANSTGATFGINQFADYTAAEMEDLFGFKVPSGNQ